MLAKKAYKWGHQHSMEASHMHSKSLVEMKAQV